MPLLPPPPPTAPPAPPCCCCCCCAMVEADEAAAFCEARGESEASAGLGRLLGRLGKLAEVHELSCIMRSRTGAIGWLLSVCRGKASRVSSLEPTSCPAVERE